MDRVSNSTPKLALGSFVVRSVTWRQGVNLWICFDYTGCISLSNLKYVLVNMQTDLVAPFYLYNSLPTTVNL